MPLGSDCLNSPALYEKVPSPSTQNETPNPSATESDRPVDHLIFVIHGIGQQTEKYGYFYQHIKSLQETTRQVLQARVPDHSVRVELVPIEWHKHIHEEVDPVMDSITLKSMPTVRLVNNDYLADALYYFARDRQQSIVNHVTKQFNTSYHTFLQKHPNFNGKIAIFGYSLGGIITWDILSHQRTVSMPEELQELEKLDVTFPRLDFKPNYLFGLGCPLGGILTIRNHNPKYYHPDDDVIFENIYHLFDPLAYRYEPLIDSSYRDEPAVLIDRSVPLSSFMSSIASSSLFSFFTRRPSYDQALSPEEEEGDGEEEEVTGHTQEEQTEGGDVSQKGGLFTSISSFFQSWVSPKSSCESSHPLDITRPNKLTLNTSRNSCSSSDEEEHEPKTPTDEVTLNSDKEEQAHLRKLRRRSRTFGSPGDLEQCEFLKHIPQHQHLVQVLGIEDISFDSLERAASNFGKQPWKNGSKSLWDDLNKELSLPPTELPPSSRSSKHPATPSLPGGRRIDYMLQPDGLMSRLANDYVVGIQAHFSYWKHKDLLWHILCRLENLDENA